MAREFNRTVTSYTSTDQKFKRKYLLDINPWAYFRDRGPGHNIIDARWIDTSNGLYVDITALSRFNPDDEPHTWECKNGHVYQTDDLYPLRQSKFEGTKALVPFKYQELLTEEYSVKALIRTTFQKYVGPTLFAMEGFTNMQSLLVIHGVPRLDNGYFLNKYDIRMVAQDDHAIQPRTSSSIGLLITHSHHYTMLDTSIEAFYLASIPDLRLLDIYDLDCDPLHLHNGSVSDDVHAFNNVNSYEYTNLFDVTRLSIHLYTSLLIDKYCIQVM